MRHKSALIVLVILSFRLLSHAQGLGSILGTVTDPSGAAIASAKIRATQAGTSFAREAISNADGYYVISALSLAGYGLSIEAGGFRPEKHEVTLLADQSLTLNVKMQLGTTSEVIQVESMRCR